MVGQGILAPQISLKGFPGGSVVKNPLAYVGDTGSNPGGENGNLLQYSCLGNAKDRVAWQLQSVGLQRV